MNNNLLELRDIQRYWDNLSVEGREQAFKILVFYPEHNIGDAKNYILSQIVEFKKFYNYPDLGVK